MYKKTLITGLLLWLSVFWFSLATVWGEIVLADIFCGDNECKIILDDFWGRGLWEMFEYDLVSNTLWESILLEDDIVTDETFVGMQKLQELRIADLELDFTHNLEFFEKLSSDQYFEKEIVEPHIIDETETEYYMTWYITNMLRKSTISLWNKLLTEIDFTTCRLDDVNYRGFGSTWSNVLAIVLSTNHWDCFEWWYIKDFIWFVQLDEVLSDDLFLETRNEIQNFEERNGVWPAMNQTIWGVFFSLSDITLEERIQQKIYNEFNDELFVDENEYVSWDILEDVEPVSQELWFFEGLWKSLVEFFSGLFR